MGEGGGRKQTGKHHHHQNLMGKVRLAVSRQVKADPEVPDQTYVHMKRPYIHTCKHTYCRSMSDVQRCTEPNRPWIDTRVFMTPRLTADNLTDPYFTVSQSDLFRVYRYGRHLFMLMSKERLC